MKGFGGLRLCDITSQDVNRYQIHRTGGVSPRTINLETKVLRMILRSVKLWSRIADDYKRLRENTRGPGKALSPEEEKHLFATASSNEGWQAAYYGALIAVNTTARSCELKGLRLADVDLMNRKLTIRAGEHQDRRGLPSSTVERNGGMGCGSPVGEGQGPGGD